MKIRPVEVKLFYADGRADGQRERERERDDEANTPFLKFCQRAFKNPKVS
jgi:hypothetical protein